MAEVLRITNGRVYDPANAGGGVDGAVRDVVIVDGRIAAALPDGVRPGAVRTIDARGMIVMPGGVDIHCHIASASVNRARAMLGEEHATHVHVAPGSGVETLSTRLTGPHPSPLPSPGEGEGAGASQPGATAHGRPFRAGTGLLTPSTFLTGYRYAALGYTTAIDAAVSPTGARQTHLELNDTPNLDAGFLLLVGNHAKVIELLAAGDESGAVAFIGELLHRTGAYGLKIVNPGGVASWRADATQHTVETIDSPIAGVANARRGSGASGPGAAGAVTPRRILELAATAAERLGLPHAPHIHCNRLGLPGNVDTTLETLAALDGRRAHLTHLQFHAYGKNEKGEITSAAARLVDYIDAHPLITADVGQVVFGSAMTLTGDTPLEHLLWQLAGKRVPGTNRYVSIEIENETGCGLMPIEYSDKQYLHSMQWAIGLELMLMARDPWRMLLSTDHPNGGSFLAYPSIIAALMDRNVREEQVKRANPRAMAASRLRELDRQMTLSEIAILTRAGPARVLGLKQKGHLGVGADGDVTIYDESLRTAAAPGGTSTGWQRVFESPRYVIKAGQVIVEDGQLHQSVQGVKLRAPVNADDQGAHHLNGWFEQHGSYSVKQFGLHRFEREAMRSV